MESLGWGVASDRRSRSAEATGGIPFAVKLFEFEDLPGLPDAIRTGMLDYLSWFLRITRFYRPTTPLIERLRDRNKGTSVIDLCSGGGGPWPQLHPLFLRHLGISPVVILTDRFPNIAAYREAAVRSGGAIGYHPTSVDATAVPTELSGVRTLFSAFHHFPKEQALGVLRQANEDDASIAVFDGGDRNLLVALGILVAHPILLVLVSPFLRPFRWDRLLFTYLIPAIPVCTVWDGLVSIRNLYSTAALNELVAQAGGKGYTWEVGTVRNALGFRINYVLGYSERSRN